jgi:hypothetical protein
MLSRRALFAWIAVAALPLRAASARLRGVLKQSADLETGDGKRIRLEGDTETSAVLRDKRLFGSDVEAVGEWSGEGRFRIEPIHESGLFVLRDGKPLLVTYWCEVCAIRTYTPGVCMCCQEETALDLREPGTAARTTASEK